MLRTTEADLTLFSKYVFEWQSKLALNDWRIYIRHLNDSDRYASCAWSIGDRIATISLSKRWDDIRDLNSRELHLAALHEVLHLLLAETMYYAESRYATEGGLDQSEHAVIKRLENVLIPEGGDVPSDHRDS
ncbi:hypothetical protein C5C39_06890 [Rathayibacter sp. AY1F3]|nr:hypothetical protein C5C39_06890 [Rathayibacter sp. AY1F3]